MIDVYLSPWITYMDYNRFNGLLVEILQVDERPDRKLNELLLQLPLPDRISFLEYIRLEYKQGAVTAKLEERYENEPAPSFLKEKVNEEMGPRDLFYLHIASLIEEMDYVCTKLIPEKLKDYYRDVEDIVQREKVLSKLNMTSEPATDEKIYNGQEAAEYLGVKIETIYYYNYKKWLKPYTHGGKLLLYTKSQLDNFRKRKK